LPTFAVDASSAGLRLDQFLARVLGLASVHAARRLIAAGRVRVDDRRATKKGEHLAADQAVTVEVETAAPAVVPDPSVVLPVLFDDGVLIAVDKPAGIASHPLRPGERGTAANGIVALYPECAEASRDAREGGLGHRLDGDTSGVLLAARTRPAWEALRAALGDPDGEKTYVAHVFGAPAAQGEFAGAIGRVGRRGARVAVDGGRQPLAARTRWEVMAVGPGPSALVRARLHAGRAHQVRAHLAAAGHAILGDGLYADEGARAAARALGVDRLRLHAESVRLRHPITGAPLIIRAPLPAWAADFSATSPAPDR
jgi:23S rRNA pseudouridine1911/1915/1917 synthase